MITVKDIARLASVSQGTVSNVLNNRGNVSAEKIQRVTDAAKQLGYVANAQAKLLRKDIPTILPSSCQTSMKSGILTFSMASSSYWKRRGIHRSFL